MSGDKNNDALWQEAREKLDDMLVKMDRFNENLYTSLNKKLATGRCFIRSGVVFYLDNFDQEKPIWFPQGNALEYQAVNGQSSALRAQSERVEAAAGGLRRLAIAEVVINVSPGGFSLSKEAILLGRALSQNGNWGGLVLEGDENGDFKLGEDFLGSVIVERHDPVLLKVVELLGDKAAGPAAKLNTVQLLENEYHLSINEDGTEFLTPKSEFPFTKIKR